MIDVTVALMKANELNNGVIITEMACIAAVERFQKQVETTHVILGKSPHAVGRLKEMRYDKEKQLLLGVLELCIDFAAGGKIANKFTTPEGERVIDCSVSTITMVIQPLIIKENKKEEVKNEPKSNEI